MGKIIQMPKTVVKKQLKSFQYLDVCAYLRSKQGTKFDELSPVEQLEEVISYIVMHQGIKYGMWLFIEENCPDAMASDTDFTYHIRINVICCIFYAKCLIVHGVEEECPALLKHIDCWLDVSDHQKEQQLIIEVIDQLDSFVNELILYISTRFSSKNKLQQSNVRKRLNEMKEECVIEDDFEKILQNDLICKKLAKRCPDLLKLFLNSLYLILKSTVILGEIIKEQDKLILQTKREKPKTYLN